MSSLSCGIVGLPNVGKSTLFNALCARRLAETAPRPFTTIEPHEAVVAVPDENLEKLWELVRGDPSTSLRMTTPDKIPAVVTFIDIAGLVKGASQGEGLGNQFLGKIREVDAVIHVVREFTDPNVSHVHNKIDPKEDIEIVNLELQLGGIVDKPTIYVYNVDEKNVNKKGEGIYPPSRNTESVCSRIKAKSFSLRRDFAPDEAWGEDTTTVRSGELYLCVKLEEELMDLSAEERKAYLRELGISQSGLEKLIQKAYLLLGLISFYTIKGGKEIHAWSLKNGKTAFDAAAEVHTDFAKNFIKAEVINVSELLNLGGWKEAKEKGKVRLEGRDYIMKNGDVVEFKIGS